jgi:hypothetical protein
MDPLLANIDLNSNPYAGTERPVASQKRGTSRTPRKLAECLGYFSLAARSPDSRPVGRATLHVMEYATRPIIT